MERRPLDYRDPSAPSEFPSLPHSKTGLVSVCCFVLWSASVLFGMQFTEGMGNELFLVLKFIGKVVVPIGAACGLFGLLEPNRTRLSSGIGFTTNCFAMIFIALVGPYD